VNYMRWFLVMCGAQVAQVVELLLTGSSARWRLNRFVADLSDVLSGCEGCTKADLTTAMASRIRGGAQTLQRNGSTSSGDNGRAPHVFYDGDEVVEKENSAAAAAAAASSAASGAAGATSAPRRVGVVVGGPVADVSALGGAKVMVRFGVAHTATGAAAVSSFSGTGSALAQQQQQQQLEPRDVGSLELSSSHPHGGSDAAGTNRAGGAGSLQAAKKKRSPWAAPIASYELMPLLRLGFFTGQTLAKLHFKGDAWWRARGGGNSAAVGGGGGGRPPSETLRHAQAWDLRWVADMRNWLFAGIVGSVGKLKRLA
jgi:hypothetical protein